MEESDVADDGRQETATERADRNWDELLQEFRVLQTGLQVLGGLLLTLPFQSRFQHLDGVQLTFYLFLVVLATVNVTLILVPIAIHRRLFRQRRKPQLVALGQRIARLSIAGIAVLVAGVASFVFDVVLGRTAGIVALVALAAVVSGLIGAVPYGAARFWGESGSDEQRDEQVEGMRER
ncbi:DUF6328 family protein [Cumulibacter manganitolerans]|uniref:DUF6328 family protein n=1 Tax=Cumulibacter manganitolerans TaxID=1884992 RepID=UPI001E3438A8|nr:DUF6328 family protein [Cumulibacter manganitolerans]